MRQSILTHFFLRLTLVPPFDYEISDYTNYGFMSEIDSMTMSAPWTRVNFGGANQRKGSEERSRT